MNLPNMKGALNLYDFYSSMFLTLILDLIYLL